MSENDRKMNRVVAGKGLMKRYAQIRVNPDFYRIVYLGPKPKEETVAITDPPRYPYKCPRCGSAAYVGFVDIECSRNGCP